MSVNAAVRASRVHALLSTWQNSGRQIALGQETFRPSRGCAREPLRYSWVSKKESGHATHDTPRRRHDPYWPRLVRRACTIDRFFGTILYDVGSTAPHNRSGWGAGAHRASAATPCGRTQPEPDRQQSGRRGDRSEAHDLPRLSVGRVLGLHSYRGVPASNGAPIFALSARNTNSGVSGNSVRRTPTASSMAFAIAGDTANVADSPAPLAPKGPLC